MGKIMKIKSLCLIVISLLTAISAVCSDKNPFFPPREYNGVATPIISTTIRFGYNDAFRGIITYVARPGAILRGAVYDMNNKVVEPADVLIQMAKDYRISVVKEKKANLKSAVANLKIAKENYLRYKKLVEKNATSVQIFQQSEADYLAAIGTKEAAEADIQLAQVMLDGCTFRAPFDLIVDEVYFPAGLCAGELDVVKISQLFPMGIKIKMDRRTATKITNKTPIVVFPVNSDKPMGIFHGLRYLTEDGIMLKVNNDPLPPPVKLDENNKRIPVCECSIATPFVYYKEKHDNLFTVPTDGIFKDEKGYYVWRGIGQQNMQLDKGLDFVFPVEKVYVEPGNYKMSIDAHSRFRALKVKGKLKPFDTVLIGVIPKGLKNNDKVCVYKTRYIFMPGDPVRVVIGK